MWGIRLFNEGFLTTNRQMEIAKCQETSHNGSMAVSGKATIHNEAGIHCRPSTHIIKSVKDYPGTFRVWCAEGESDLRSMLSLMMLSLTCGTEVEIEVDGPDEEARLAELITLFETEYDFPQ